MRVDPPLPYRRFNRREVDLYEMFVGNHSKAEINLSFPTGAVIAFSCAVFSSWCTKFRTCVAWVDVEWRWGD